jgi:hypothetical protein
VSYIGLPIRSNLLVTIFHTSKKIPVGGTCGCTLFGRQVAEAKLLLTQRTACDRVVPATDIEPPSQLVNTQPVGATAGLIQVTVASHVATTVGLFSCVLFQATTAIAFTYSGGQSLQHKTAITIETHQRTPSQRKCSCSLCKLKCRLQWSYAPVSTERCLTYGCRKNRCSIQGQSSHRVGEAQGYQASSKIRKRQMNRCSSDSRHRRIRWSCRCTADYTLEERRWLHFGQHNRRSSTLLFVFDERLYLCQ